MCQLSPTTPSSTFAWCDVPIIIQFVLLINSLYTPGFWNHESQWPALWVHPRYLAECTVPSLWRRGHTAISLCEMSLHLQGGDHLVREFMPRFSAKLAPVHSFWIIRDVTLAYRLAYPSNAIFMVRLFRVLLIFMCITFFPWPLPTLVFSLLFSLPSFFSFRLHKGGATSLFNYCPQFHWQQPTPSSGRCLAC